ncbi:MAG TPA: PfkB family carbohydrate kinase [Acidobacteriota bacterium]|nr:PfkB family carbohydrate kinase [Acidobacteriota bacterium]
MKELLELLPKLRGKRIGVYGDLIADEYVYGTIHRFSREAPVFIVNYEEAQIGLGGAANAINNIHALGGIPYPLGVLGNDHPGRTLLAVMKEKGIPTEGIVSDYSHPTFVKQRIVAGSPHSVRQQILRLDRCVVLPNDAACHANLQDRLKTVMGKLDALIVSDYGLGVANPLKMEETLAEVERKGIPVFVDSRQRIPSFKHVTAATPNEPEVESLIGKVLEGESLIEAGNELLQRFGMKALLITRGKNGMALFTRDSAPAMIPIFGSTNIVDVTGAGDTVISTFTLAVTSGASFYDAARLANCAAGITVMKRGAATVTIEELSEAIRVATMHQ